MKSRKHKHDLKDFNDEEDTSQEYKRIKKKDTDVNQGKLVLHSSDKYISKSSLENEFKFQQEESDFNWCRYKKLLDEIYFTDKDLIKYGSKEHIEFWKFLEKYQAFQKNKCIKSKSNNPNEKITNSNDFSNLNELGMKMLFDKLFKINLQLAEDRTEKVLIKQEYKERKLSRERLQIFCNVLMHYHDFLQKQKFSKLKKINLDQQNLPIYRFKMSIVEAIRENQVVIVAGDTGCGKSTQVPQYLLEAGFKNIACTQPRRIACISLAKRVSFETLNDYGTQVAYQVRFDKTKTSATKILFLTEGLLMRQVEMDGTLSRYDVIMMDEVHERHMHTDFILGVLKCILCQRSNLKLVLMSATINLSLFSSYFDGCPVAMVPGRLHPIELRYLPPEIKNSKDGSSYSRKYSNKLDPSPFVHVLQLIDHKYMKDERGDVLMFLSGLTEIDTVVEAVKEYAKLSQNWIILPLHSSLSLHDQDKVFDYPPEGVRKCIIATNIAETSITIDGVRFVVDSGKVKELNHDGELKMGRLKECWTSKASAEQRKGRAGRTGPGVCFRLFSEKDYQEMEEYSAPEVARVPLDSLVLQMISLGIPDPKVFPFIEKPPQEKIEVSLKKLRCLDAITGDDYDIKITPIGETLSKLPVDIQIGKLLIVASALDVLDSVMSLAAGLCIQSLFTNKAHRDLDASNLRKSLESDDGDLSTLLNLFEAWIELKNSDSEGHKESKRWCKKRGIEEQRLYEIDKLRIQFQELLRDQGLMAEQLDGCITDDSDNLSEVGGKGESQNSWKNDPVKRREHHANRNLLENLRKKRRQMDRKKKILKHGQDSNESTDEESTGKNKLNVDGSQMDIEVDIRDLEFRLLNDRQKLKRNLDRSRKTSRKDATLLKMVICCGLYPQFALADEHNSFKPDSEQVYHTQSKNFVLLHPTSVLTRNPESLQIRDHEVKECNYHVASSKQRGPLSSKHQILAYVTLLETTKPYLINCMRIPALQGLLLHSKSIDTCSDCSRIVFDKWIDIEFETVEDGQNCLLMAVRQRSIWQILLDSKLLIAAQLQKDDLTKNSILIKLLYKRENKLRNMLLDELKEFLHSEIYYRIRRIHSAELNKMYVGRDDSRYIDDGLGDNNWIGYIKNNLVKGGLQITPYLSYDSLIDGDRNEFSLRDDRIQWSCLHCKTFENWLTIAERLKHVADCIKKQFPEITDKSDVKNYISDSDNSIHSTRKTKFKCDLCGNSLKCNTVEMIQHRKNCKKNISTASEDHFKE